MLCFPPKKYLLIKKNYLLFVFLVTLQFHCSLVPPAGSNHIWATFKIKRSKQIYHKYTIVYLQIIDDEDEELYKVASYRNILSTANLGAQYLQNGVVGRRAAPQPDLLSLKLHFWPCW